MPKSGTVICISKILYQVWLSWRMTRWDCEIIAQNVAKDIIFLINMCIWPYKKEANILGYFCGFQTAQSKQLPSRRKLAQSGHPALKPQFKWLKNILVSPQTDRRSTRTKLPFRWQTGPSCHDNIIGPASRRKDGQALSLSVRT
jgi:hypothetical protein